MKNMDTIQLKAGTNYKSPREKKTTTNLCKAPEKKVMFECEGVNFGRFSG